MFPVTGRFFFLFLARTLFWLFFWILGTTAATVFYMTPLLVASIVVSFLAARERAHLTLLLLFVVGRSAFDRFDARRRRHRRRCAALVSVTWSSSCGAVTAAFVTSRRRSARAFARRWSTPTPTSSASAASRVTWAASDCSARATATTTARLAASTSMFATLETLDDVGRRCALATRWTIAATTSVRTTA